MPSGFSAQQSLRRPLLRRVVFGVGLALGLAAFAARAAESPDTQRVGQLIRVAGALGDTAELRIRRVAHRLMETARSSGKSAVLVLEFQSGTPDFGKALDLARLLTSEDFATLRCVAYLPESVSGHTVLAVVACDEIIMAPAAEVGAAGKDERALTADVRSAYREIAQRKRTVPEDVVLGWLDPALAVWQVETEVGREFALEDRLGEIESTRAVKSKTLVLPAGGPARFTGREARELGLVSYLATDRANLAKALALPPTAVGDDLALDEPWQPVLVRISGQISPSHARRLQRMIDEQITRRDANWVCLEIDSPGGSAVDALSLANYIAGLDGEQVRTVAYVPRAARGAAAYLALAADHLLMAPGAELGGVGDFPLGVDDVASTAASLAAIAKAQGHNPALARAMVDSRAAVFEYRRASDGLVDYFSPDELEEKDAALWQQGERIGKPNQPLALLGNDAQRLNLALATVERFDDLKSLYGLEHDPRPLQTGWVDALVDFLTQPGVQGLLIALAMLAFYAELHTPGVGLGALAGALCLMLFFWANYLGGTADALEIVMFVCGLGCLGVELFLFPGLGVFGLAGGVLILGSLVLASQTFIWPHDAYQAKQLQVSLTQLVTALVVAAVGASVLRRYLFTRPILSGVVLQPPTEDERRSIAHRESLAHFDHLLGQRAVVATRLSPAGKIRVGGQTIDVVADGNIIEPGTTVEVVSVQGHRVVVRAVD